MNDNIISFQGGKKDEKTLPSAKYCITTMQNEEVYGEGFLVFTTHHVAIMRDTGEGAVPTIIVPLVNVNFAEIIDDEEILEDIL